MMRMLTVTTPWDPTSARVNLDTRAAASTVQVGSDTYIVIYQLKCKQTHRIVKRYVEGLKERGYCGVLLLCSLFIYFHCILFIYYLFLKKKNHYLFFW